MISAIFAEQKERAKKILMQMGKKTYSFKTYSSVATGKKTYSFKTYLSDKK